jgi:arsenite methyltransferase
MSSVVCPVSLDTAKLNQAILDTYSRVAVEPGGEYHFNRGPAYAASHLGYDPEELARLPAACTEPFAGVGNPLAIVPLSEGETVLDVGSGAGMDLLLAARCVAPAGRAIGVDRTDAMIAVCRRAVQEARLANVEVREGDLHALPLDDGSVDAVISNGVLNLAHDKRRAFSELRRVLRPGGRLQLADIVVDDPLSDGIRGNFQLWAD